MKLWISNQLHLPSGDVVWVKSSLNFAPAREVLVARELLCWLNWLRFGCRPAVAVGSLTPDGAHFVLREWAWQTQKLKWKFGSGQYQYWTSKLQHGSIQYYRLSSMYKSSLQNGDAEFFNSSNFFDSSSIEFWALGSFSWNMLGVDKYWDWTWLEEVHPWWHRWHSFPWHAPEEGLWNVDQMVPTTDFSFPCGPACICFGTGGEGRPCPEILQVAGKIQTCMLLCDISTKSAYSVHL